MYSIQADTAGQIWIGLDNAEILRYAEGNWTFFDTCATVFPYHIVLTSAAAANGDRWFSFFDQDAVGLARYDADGRLTGRETLSVKSGAARVKGRKLAPGDMEFIVIGE